MMSSAVAQGEYQAPDPLLTADTSTARSSVVVSVGFLFSGILGALLAFVIAVLVGEGAETDGFLAAYVIYLAFVLFGSTLRVALVPLLGPTTDAARFRLASVDSVRRILAVAGAGFLVLVVASPVMGLILVPGASSKTQSTASLSTAILAAAAYCQVWSALLSAVLAATRRFVASAVLYSMSGIVTLGVGAALMAAIDIWGATIGVLAGALTLLGGHLVYMRRFGFVVWPAWRPALESATWKLAALAAAGASVPLCFQLDVTISIATIAEQANAVTAYTYAYFLTVLLSSITGGVIGLVTMPNLIAALHERGRETLREYLREMAPFAVFFYLPLAAGYAVFGRPLLDAIFEGPLTEGTVDLLWDTSRIFLLMGLAWCLLVPVTTIALSLRMFRELAVLAVCMIGVHAALVIPAGTLGPRAVAAAHAVSGTLVVVMVLVMVFRRESLRAGLDAVWVSLPAGVLALVFPVLGLTALGDGGVVEACAGLLVGAALYVGLGIGLWPSVGRRAVTLLKQHP
jgi:peptidoglycan biosynthesis protein MviN/MurJ (putative lipid II flippase)